MGWLLWGGRRGGEGGSSILRSPQTASTVHLSQMELFQLLNKLFDTTEKRKEK